MAIAVVHLIVAGLTERDQVPRFKAILWVMLNRKDMMDVFAGPHLSIAPALLALIAVPPEDALPCIFPFC